MDYSQLLGYVHGYLDSLVVNDKVTKEAIEDLVQKINNKIKTYEDYKNKNAIEY